MRFLALSALCLALTGRHCATAGDANNNTFKQLKIPPPPMIKPPKGFIPPFPPMGVNETEWEELKKAHSNNTMSTAEWADFLLAHPMPPRNLDVNGLINLMKKHPHPKGPLPPFPPPGLSEDEWTKVRENHPNGWENDQEQAKFMMDHPFPPANITKDELVAYLENHPFPPPPPRPMRPPQKGFIPPFPPVPGVGQEVWEQVKKAHPNHTMTTSEWADFLLAHPIPPKNVDVNGLVAIFKKYPHPHAKSPLPPFPPHGVKATEWNKIRTSHPNGWESDEERAKFMIDHPFPPANITKERLVAYLKRYPFPNPKTFDWHQRRHHHPSQSPQSNATQTSK